MRKLPLLLLATLLFTSCQKQIPTEQVQKDLVSAELRSGTVPNVKIKVCHQNGVEIAIDESSLAAHIAHGDAVDMDNDGFFDKDNPCSATDCNDNNAAITPGVSEICDNGIDDNCNGQVDEGCITTFVTICNQVWMTKNLDVSSYRNGDIIPQVTDPLEWTNLTTGAWCYYENSSANGTVYGKLYNWLAVNDSRGLAPAGWHVPNDAEWTTLTDCLGGVAVAGNAMKETGTSHWLSSNIGVTNSSGFTGLGGGYRSNGGWFDGIGIYGIWWSSTENNENGGARYLYSTAGNVGSGLSVKLVGHYVRCVRD